MVLGLRRRYFELKLEMCNLKLQSSGLDALFGELHEDEDPSSEGPSSQSGRGEKSQGVKRKAPPTTPSRGKESRLNGFDRTGKGAALVD